MRVISYDRALKSDIVTFDFEKNENVVRILGDIKTSGTDAVKKYNNLYDGYDNYPLELTNEEIEAAFSKVDQSFLEAIEFAKANIEQFAKAQRSQLSDFTFENEFGVFGHRLIPVESVLCYVPGGNYPLPSTALMTVLPAKVAGVEEVYVTSPKIQAETIVAASLAGADRIFRLGGVQAIGAFAYGTSTIPQVDKIVGPGNKYVTLAKKEVYGTVGLDFLAGPSEILIIADESASIPIIASDLLAQAEHDVNSKIFVVTDSANVAKSVRQEVYSQLLELETCNIAEKSVENGNIILCKNIEEIISIADSIAPEHLEIQISDPNRIVEKLQNYGSLFIGSNSAEVFGDYCSGPNHTLPTGRAARYTGGLSVFDFLKIQTFQELNEVNLEKLVETASQIAMVEGLDGHRKSSLLRIK